MDIISNIPEAIIIALMVSVLVVGLMANATVCAVILWTRSMHTIANYYILSLSVSDILILITHVFREIFMICLAYEAFYKKWYEKWWNISEWIFKTGVNASTLTITAFTCERYLAICHPFIIQAMPKTSRVNKIIVAVWLIAALLTTLSAVEWWILFRTHRPNSMHLMQKVIFYFEIIIVALYFFIPMIVMIIMYVFIGIEFKRSSNKWQTTNRNDCDTKKTLKMFVFIVVALFLCWLPHYTLKIDKACMVAGKQCRLSHNALELMNLSEIISIPVYPTLNPLIYTLMSKNFRKAFEDLLSKTKTARANLTTNSRSITRTTNTTN